jgi:cytochrome c oxidase cbb3-type subunit 3
MTASDPRSLRSSATTAVVTAVAIATALAVFAAPPPPAPSKTDEAPPAAIAQPPEGWTLDGDAERGREPYEDRCAACHGAAGDGQAPMTPFLDPKPTDFTDPERLAGRSDWELYLAVRDGGRAVGLSQKMTAFGPYLEDQEIRDLVAFVKGFSAAEPPAEP